MLKKTFAAAVMATFLFTSCSEAKQDTTATAGTENMEHHEGMAHGETGN